MPNAVFFYLLFNDFYKKSYNKPVAVKSSSAAKKNGHLTNGHAKSEDYCPPPTQDSNGNVVADNKDSKAKAE